MTAPWPTIPPKPPTPPLAGTTAESGQTPMDALAIEQGRRTEAERRVCSQTDCPGDGRYQPPGRGHLPNCQHNAVTWTWEVVDRG